MNDRPSAGELVAAVRQYLEAAIYPTQLKTLMELEQLSTVAGMAS